MSLFLLYLIFVLPGVAESWGVHMFLFGLLGAVGWLAGFVFEGEDSISEIDRKKFGRAQRYGGLAVFVFWGIGLSLALIPSEKAMYAILGGYVVTNIEGVEKLGPNFVGAANAFMEQYQQDQGE